MKKTVMILAALAVSSAWAITATKEYVDRSTNACLIAANRYTDEHGGGGGGGASTNVVNDLIVSYDQTNLAARIAASTKVESVNGKTGVVTIVGADVGNIAWSALTNQYGESVSAVDISYQPPEEGAFDPNVRSALDSIYYTAHDAQNTISSHVSNYSNPHDVTASQIGAVRLNDPSGSQSIYGDVAVGGEFSALSASFSTTVGAGSFNASIGITHGGDPVVYGVSTNGSSYLHENVNLKPWGDGILSKAEAGSASIATNAAKAVVEPVSNVVFNAETYFAIDKDNLSLVSYSTNIWQSVYELTNFTDATSINVYSGQIVRDQLSAANTNLSVTLKFPAGAQSAGDAILRMVCATNSVIGIVAVDGASAYELKGADKWNELNPGDSLVTFTKTAVTNGVWEIWCSKAESGL